MTVAENPDGFVAWRLPSEVVDQLIGWFSCPVRLAPPDRFPEPEKAVLFTGPTCDPAELKEIFAAWAEAEPEMPRLCAQSCLLDQDFAESISSGSNWLDLVWLPVPWPLNPLSRWILFRALHGSSFYFDHLATDMALARRMDMLKRRNIDLARETVRLRQQAMTCPLTGLPNRRAMDRVLAREFAQGPLRQPTALGLVDIDHFKAWNERVLHTGGDILLTGLANRLCESLRETDLLARIGGEEFQVLARNSDAEGALALGERLRQLVVSRPFDCAGQSVTMTISVGIAAAPAGAQVASHDLAKLAASALKEAKQAGRDRVVVLQWPDQVPFSTF